MSTDPPQADAPTDTPAAESPREHATLDELPQEARKQEQQLRKQEAQAEASSASSTMEKLTRGSKPIGERTRLKILQQEEEPRLPASALESLLSITPQDAPRRTASEADRQPVKPGDPSTTAPRMSLWEPEGESRDVPRLEALLTFSSMAPVGRTQAEEHRGTSSLDGLLHTRGGPVDLGLSGSPEPPSSSLSGADLPSGGGPMRLRRPRATSQLNMPNDLSRLVGQQPLPRARLPRRTTANQPQEVDGFTPLRPMQVAIRCTLAGHQRCPKRKTPTEVGERLHHRLEFRFNRFELLEVTQVLYECPGQEEPFAGADPAFFSLHAPFGNGMLARLIVAMVRDGMPMNRIGILLSQLEAPLDNRVVLTQIAEVAAALTPVVEQIRADMGKATTEPHIPVLYSGAERDELGHLLVHTARHGVVLEYRDGEARGAAAESGVGVRLREASRDKGRTARWGQVRRKFFYALVTDNRHARRALRLLDQLPALPDSSTDAASLSRLKRWLDGEYETFKIPKSRLQHAVNFAFSMWPLLLEDGPKSYRKELSPQWMFTPNTLRPADAACLYSIMETCAIAGIDPWAYLNDLLGQFATGEPLPAKKWTPAAWKVRHG